MDEVLEKLNKTKFEALYKYKNKELENQEQRRKEMLRLQRIKRSDITDRFRGVLGLVDTEEGEEEENVFQQRTVPYTPQIYVAGFTKFAYKDVLMMSEWMIEKPLDFHENWYVVPCPKGMRTLVIASQGKTKLYSRDGHHVKTYQSALPGGNKSPGRNSRCCILDGFFMSSTHTLYVLDVLAWNRHIMADGETEFRNYWLISQFKENPDLEKHTVDNHLSFKIIPKVPCDRDNLAEFMYKIPHFPHYTPKLDGLLFYHKQAHYISGPTPLVGWLYPFMVPEVLGADIKVNPAYMMEKPVNYINQADFISKFTKRKRRQAADCMDITTDDTDLLVVESLTVSGAFGPDETSDGNEARGVKME